MKKFSLLYLFFLLPIIVMIVIFLLSSENAEESSQTSAEVVEVVANIVIKDYKEKPQTEQKSIIDSLQNLVRKTAHFVIYFILGLSWILSLKINSNFKNSTIILLSQLTSTIYAILDETHQSFVDGRGPGLFDVILDSFGAFIGIILFVILLKIIISIKHKKVAQLQ